LVCFQTTISNQYLRSKIINKSGAKTIKEITLVLFSELACWEIAQPAYSANKQTGGDKRKLFA